MKRKILLILIMLLLPAITVFAHGGKTDGAGGHRDNQNKSGLGYYHYHCGGHPPHLHEDGVCPYSSGLSSTPKAEFKPKTYDTNDLFDSKPKSSISVSSSISNGTSHNSNIVSDVQKQNDSQQSSKNKDDKRRTGDIVAAVLALIFFIVPLCIAILQFIWETVILGVYENVIYKLSPICSIKKYEEVLSCAKKERIEIEELYREIIEIGKKIVIPNNCEIGNDGLPREKSFEVWGKQFTVYTTSYGKSIHKKYRCSGATNKHHICDLEKNSYYSYCLKCYNEYPSPDLTWFYASKDYKRKSVTYNNLIKNFENTIIEAEKCYTKCNRKMFRLFTSLSKAAKLRLDDANIGYYEFNKIPSIMELPLCPQ